MLLLLCLLAYLLGSIPFGFILTRLAGLGDIRQIGSGNIGATNVLRTGHKGLAALTLLLDGAKGFLAVWLARQTDMDMVIYLTGLLAVLGHIFPIWLKGKGGKGVATAIGVTLGISWLLGFCIIAVWLLVFFITRISSLSALSGFAVNSVTAAIIGSKSDAMFILLMTALLCYTHRENIRRLLAGNEHGFKKDKP